MKIILTSDWHGTTRTPVGRKDNIEDTFFVKLAYIYERAEELNAIILQAGDMCHKPREWYFLAKLIRFLKDHKEVQLYTIYGQHDAYLYSETTKHATVTGILERVGLLALLSPNPVRLKSGLVTVAIYGCSWGQEVPKAENRNDFNILVIHAPISFQPIYPGQEINKPLQFLNKHLSFDIILCGDIHRSFIIKSQDRFILNTGPLIRMEASEYNFEFQPAIAILDTNTGQIDEEPIPCQPADKVLSRRHIEIEQETTQMLDTFVRNIKTKWQAEVDIMANLQDFIEQNQIPQEVVDIISEVIASARE